MTKEKRWDAPREGATRYTVILDRQLVEFLKNFSKEKQIKITDLVGDALEHWIERIKQNTKRY